MEKRTRILSNDRGCMGWLWLLLLLASSLSVQAASPIPEGRSIDWSNTGVPGGISNRPTIFATIDADAYGNGTTDASSAINAALAECPADQVVYLPPGTYRLNSPIHFRRKQGVTLRGAGMGKTVLKPADGLGAAITSGQVGLSSERKILSGSTKGSRSINVEDATGIEPGMILDIIQDDDPDFYWTRRLVNHTGQFVMVTAVDGTTIRFEDPLVWSFTLNPRCRPSRRRGMSWCGVEDLTITAGSSYRGGMIKYWHAYASWVKNVETTPRCNGETLKPGIRNFETERTADTFTLPAGGLWSGEENPASVCHVQVLLPSKRTVRWVGGIDPDLDVPSENLIPGLYRIKLTAHSREELKMHPDWGGQAATDRYCFGGWSDGNRAGRVETQIPFHDPNIGRIRCGFWLQPATETRRLEPGESMLWQARVTKETLTILLNGKSHAEYPFDKFPTVGAIEKEMFRSLRTPGNSHPWNVALIRGYEWWVDNWREPTTAPGPLGDARKQGFHFDEPEKVGWPIPGSALDGGMFRMGGIYAKAYPLYERKQYSQRATKVICGLWRMETMPRAEAIKPQVHFLHVLSPVDRSVPPPESRCTETDTEVLVTIETSKGKVIALALKKLGQLAGGHIQIESPEGKVSKELAPKIDLTGAQRGT